MRIEIVSVSIGRGDLFSCRRSEVLSLQHYTVSTKLIETFKVGKRTFMIYLFISDHPQDSAPPGFKSSHASYSAELPRHQKSPLIAPLPPKTFPRGQYLVVPPASTCKQQTVQPKNKIKREDRPNLLGQPFCSPNRSPCKSTHGDRSFPECR